MSSLNISCDSDDRLYTQRPWASPGIALIALESDCWFSSTVIEPCQNRGLVSYSWWLTEGNPTNICSVTNLMKRLVAKHAWHPPVAECSDGPHSFTQRTFYYSEYPFEKKASFKKKNRYSVLSHQQRPSIHQTVVLEHSFLWPLKKGKWRFMVFSIHHPLKAASPHFSRWTFFSPSFCAPC